MLQRFARVRILHQLRTHTSSLARSPSLRHFASPPPQITICGVDIGSESGSICAYVGGDKQIMETPEGTRRQPSYVSFFKNKEGDVETLVGISAKRQALAQPKNTFFAVNRLLGKKFSDPETTHLQSKFPFKLVEASDGTGETHVHCEMTGKSHSPTELLGQILQQHATNATNKLNQPITKIVLTHPSYFDEHQKLLLKDAAKAAGLQVMKLVPEPVAAAIAYGLNKTSSLESESIVAVYDLGGGSFDVSILKISESDIEILATSGDQNLGGKAFDNVLLDHIADQFEEESSIDLRMEPLCVQRLNDLVETAKIELSSKNQTSISAPYITADQTGPKHLDMDLNRAQYERLVSKLIRATFVPCAEVLDDAGISKEDLTDVLLVGGMARVPIIKTEVEKFFGKTPASTPYPDEVISDGAAMQGAVLSLEMSEDGGTDVLPLSIGIETLGGVFQPIFLREDTYFPCEMTESFKAVVDGQKMMKLRFFQGERPLVADNKLMGELEFPLNETAHADVGKSTVDVKFEIDKHGKFIVTVTDPVSEDVKRVEFMQPITQDEQIASTIQEAEDHEDVDNAKRETVELTYESDRMIWSIESYLNEVDDVDEKMRESLASCVSNLRTKRDGDNLEEFRQAFRDFEASIRLLLQPSDSESGENLNENAM